MSARPEIKVTFPGGLRVDAEYKGFTVKTDQPVHEGGEGTAPAPFDLFLVSLATCAGFYTLAFCRERGIPTEKAGVILRTEKDPETKMISRVAIELGLPPGFPEKYHRAIIKAVDTCSVKAHILKPPVIEVSVKTPA
jgi:ribosomal protein S12 methylthiotransferase accessory factor